MKRGKAAGLDNLTAEHLQHCHALLPGVLAMLFNSIVQTGYIPAGFGYSIPYQFLNRKQMCSLKHIMLMISEASQSSLLYQQFLSNVL